MVEDGELGAAAAGIAPLLPFEAPLPLPFPFSVAAPFSPFCPLPFPLASPSGFFSFATAMTTDKSLSPSLVPFVASIAFDASSAVEKDTKPKPRHLPSPLLFTSMDVTLPCRSNNALTESDVASSGRFFTQSFAPSGTAGSFGAAASFGCSPFPCLPPLPLPLPFGGVAVLLSAAGAPVCFTSPGGSGCFFSSSFSFCGVSPFGAGVLAACAVAEGSMGTAGAGAASGAGVPPASAAAAGAAGAAAGADPAA
mmetsp:Transcript_66272/g.191288  ORF Transcript_66272/g.191288 Transcript_66272/m.191288 type:complete len:252 (-) Transcript_66272:86-841(-)